MALSISYAPSSWIVGAFIAVPWLCMYITCFMLYYEADPSRKQPPVHIPYISGMLGDRDDDPEQSRVRITAWSIAILITILDRVLTYRALQSPVRIVRWMALYFVVWEFTVFSAGWDAHPSTNPFKRWLHGSTIHFLFSFLFFAVAGCESFNLNLRRLFPAHASAIGCALGVYISLYCALFALEKLRPGLGWMGRALLPAMEHLMMLGHVVSDSAGMAMLLDEAGLRRREFAEGVRLWGYHAYEQVQGSATCAGSQVFALPPSSIAPVPIASFEKAAV